MPIGQRPPRGHVAKEFYLGNTHVLICDDYCRGKTAQEVQEILDRVAELVKPDLVNQMLREPEKWGIDPAEAEAEKERLRIEAELEMNYEWY